jgi:hypothetical protein
MSASDRENVESIIMSNGLCPFAGSRTAVLTACVTLLVVTPLTAQTASGSKPPAAPPQQGVMIGGAPRQSSNFERCVDVRVGGENAFGCLNETLKRQVDRVNPSMNLPPFDARSSDISVGNVNQAAVREQYGSNYGRSAFPYRPAAPTFVPSR